MPNVIIHYCLFIQSYIHFFSKSSLSKNYVPGTILDAQNKSVNQTKTAVLKGFVCVLMGLEGNKNNLQTKYINSC